MAVTELIDKKLAAQFKHSNGIVKDWENGWLYVGREVHLIRETRSYQTAGFEKFKDWCETNKVINSEQRASQIINAYLAVEELRQSNFKELPEVESHAYELANSADHVDDRVNVWGEVIERSKLSNKKVTREFIKSVADELYPKLHEEKKPRKSLTQSEVQEHAKVTPERDPATEAPAATSIPENVIADIQPEKTVEFTGVPSGGTSFEPDEFDVSRQADAELDSIVVKGDDFLRDVIVHAKEAKQLQREINELKRKIMAYSEKRGGSYLHGQDCERLCEQLRINIKSTAFECRCPSCKFEPLKSCSRCAGRGFLSAGQARQMTAAETKWVDSQKSTPEKV